MRVCFDASDVIVHKAEHVCQPCSKMLSKRSTPTVMQPRTSPQSSNHLSNHNLRLRHASAARRFDELASHLCSTLIRMLEMPCAAARLTSGLLGDAVRTPDDGSEVESLLLDDPNMSSRRVLIDGRGRDFLVERKDSPDRSS